MEESTIGQEWVDLPEPQLVERAKTEPDAFALLYDRYVDRIYGYAWRATGDRMSAQDITAATFEKALRALPQFKSRGAPFSAWLYRIAHNELVSHWRRRRALRLLPRRRSGEDLVVREVEGREARNEVRLGLGRLSRRDRDVLHLRFFEELSTVEVASVLGCSTNSVYVRVHRALKRLEKELATTQREAEVP